MKKVGGSGPSAQTHRQAEAHKPSGSDRTNAKRRQVEHVDHDVNSAIERVGAKPRTRTRNEERERLLLKRVKERLAAQKAAQEAGQNATQRAEQKPAQITVQKAEQIAVQESEKQGAHTEDAGETPLQACSVDTGTASPREEHPKLERRNAVRSLSVPGQTNGSGPDVQGVVELLTKTVLATTGDGATAVVNTAVTAAANTGDGTAVVLASGAEGGFDCPIL